MYTLEQIDEILIEKEIYEQIRTEIRKNRDAVLKKNHKFPYINEDHIWFFIVKEAFRTNVGNFVKTTDLDIRAYILCNIPSITKNAIWKYVYKQEYESDINKAINDTDYLCKYFGFNSTFKNIYKVAERMCIDSGVYYPALEIANDVVLLMMKDDCKVLRRYQYDGTPHNYIRSIVTNECYRKIETERKHNPLYNSIDLSDSLNEYSEEDRCTFYFERLGIYSNTVSYEESMWYKFNKITEYLKWNREDKEIWLARYIYKIPAKKVAERFPNLKPANIDLKYHRLNKEFWNLVKRFR